MYRLMRALALSAIFSGCSIGNPGDSVDLQGRRLAVVARHAERICGVISTRGYSQEVVREEIRQATTELAELGSKTASEILRTKEYDGPLQQDIALLLGRQIDCRNDVSKRLEELLLDPLSRTAVVAPIRDHFLYPGNSPQQSKCASTFGGKKTFTVLLGGNEYVAVEPFGRYPVITIAGQTVLWLEVDQVGARMSGTLVREGDNRPAAWIHGNHVKTNPYISVQEPRYGKNWIRVLSADDGKQLFYANYLNERTFLIEGSFFHQVAVVKVADSGLEINSEQTLGSKMRNNCVQGSTSGSMIDLRLEKNGSVFRVYLGT